MAVYTKISRNEIISIERKFNLGKIISFKGIKKGIENTNYLIRTKNNKYILTIFEKRVQKKDLPFFMSLMDKLNNHKINCPKPQKSKKGNYLVNIKNKLKIKDCYEIGKNIAKLHMASKKIKLYRKNSMSLSSWSKLLNKIGNKSNKIDINLNDLMKNSLRYIKKRWPRKLSSGIIHGDLFIDNIFFKNNKFYGYIDFYFSSNDFLIYEIAICINALCFDKKNKKSS